ncbi:hypothetical protein HDV06_002136 [Boothiomyces sp. JEL0866]|nr:hypothetical protein HDV06_002136 [Boothiomyces sp. JEL0866]
MKKWCKFARRYTQGIILVNQSYMGSMYNDVSTLGYKSQFSVKQLESMLNNTSMGFEEIWRYYQCTTHDYESLKNVPATVYSLLFQSIAHSPNMEQIDYLIRDMKMINRIPKRIDFQNIFTVCKQLNRDVLLQIERWSLEKSKTIDLLEILVNDMKKMDILDQIPLMIRIISFTQSDPVLTWQISGSMIDGLPLQVMFEVCVYLHSCGIRLPDFAYTELLKDTSISALELLIENKGIEHQPCYDQLFLKADEMGDLEIASKLWDKMVPQFKSAKRVFSWETCFIYIEILMKHKKYYEASLVFKRFFSLQNGQVWTFKKQENLYWITKYRKLCDQYRCSKFTQEYDYIK